MLTVHLTTKSYFAQKNWMVQRQKTNIFVERIALLAETVALIKTYVFFFTFPSFFNLFSSFHLPQSFPLLLYIPLSLRWLLSPGLRLLSTHTMMTGAKRFDLSPTFCFDSLCRDLTLKAAGCLITGKHVNTNPNIHSHTRNPYCIFWPLKTNNCQSIRPLQLWQVAPL